jgi:hypothetical protein
VDADGIAKICEALFLDYGLAYSGSRSRGPHMSISCPLALKTHGDAHDGNLSCSVQIVDDGHSLVRCWSGNCRFKGTLLRLVKKAVEYRGNTPELLEVLKEVQAIEGITLSSKHSRSTKAIQKIINRKKTFAQDRDVIPERFFDPFAGSVPQYAVDRGITLATAKAWGLGYDKEKGYLVFPVRRRDQALVGLVGRACSSKAKRKHQNYMGLDKSKHLYGAHMLETGKSIIIVEACVDAIMTWQALTGRAGVVASLGEGFSETHIKLISAMRPPAVYIFTDGDSAGRLMANKIFYGLRETAPVKIMECPWGPVTGYKEVTRGRTVINKAIRPGVDPAILPPDYINRLFDNAPLIRGKIKWTNPPTVFDPSVT